MNMTRCGRVASEPLPVLTMHDRSQEDDDDEVDDEDDEDPEDDDGEVVPAGPNVRVPPPNCNTSMADISPQG
jgi:hypothetical protein